MVNVYMINIGKMWRWIKMHEKETYSMKTCAFRKLET